MNLTLWILQILLALHTAIGAVWKFSHSAEQTMPSLKAIPSGAWLTLSVVELAVALCLVFPAFYKPLSILVPVAAICIIADMLLLTGVHIFSGDSNYGPIGYWLVVALISAFIAYGRLTLKPF
ncbi:DoxX family protein [Neptunicella sp. SCSIO 80796]|uniref:DoxX family protein n=1 Tax=Neptunicella plasticusilytica TaxID=3117012 RepID=UPI003A4D2B8A